MKRMKPSILAAAMFAALAVSVLGASAASASFELTESECGAGLPTFCYENEATKKLLEFKGVEELLGSQESAEPHLLLGELGELIRIECSGGTLTATANQTEPLVRAGNMTDVLVKFTGCKITETAALVTKCKVVEELIETKSLRGELSNEDPVKLDLTPTEGEVIYRSPITDELHRGQSRPRNEPPGQSRANSGICVSLTSLRRRPDTTCASNPNRGTGRQAIACTIAS